MTQAQKRKGALQEVKQRALNKVWPPFKDREDTAPDYPGGCLRLNPKEKTEHDKNLNGLMPVLTSTGMSTRPTPLSLSPNEP